MKVSVIIPTFNRFNFLLNAVKSVRSQTHTDIELIIVNDGSTQLEYYSDQLLKICSPNTLIVHCKQNSSTHVGKIGRAAYTRNIGLKIATGDYVAFLDDDDVWLPTKLEVQLREMKESKCEMSCTEGLIGSGVYNPDKSYPKYLSEHYRGFFAGMGIDTLPKIWTKQFLSMHNSCITSSVIVNKNIIDRVGKMPYKRVGEDYAYWLKIIEHTDCVFCPEELIYYDANHGDGALY